MTRKEVLGLLADLFRDAVIMKSDPGDESGLSTVYTVDQEQLMNNIEHALEKEIGDGDDQDG